MTSPKKTTPPPKAGARPGAAWRSDPRTSVAPRLNSIQGEALAAEILEILEPFARAWGAARTVEACAESIRDGVRWAQTGEGNRDAFEASIALLTSSPLGARLPLASDPDRLTMDPIDRLALVALAVGARASIGRFEKFVPIAGLAALASLSVRTVRKHLEASEVSPEMARSYLQGQGVPRI
jgi:hypothetical protein